MLACYAVSGLHWPFLVTDDGFVEIFQNGIQILEKSRLQKTSKII